MKIDLIEIERQRLERLDSPQRIAWLREKMQKYSGDHAARSFFRLPIFLDMAGRSHKEHALEGYTNLASTFNLAGEEAQAAFRADWDVGLKLAVLAGEKLKISALSHIKASGETRGIESVLQAARNKFPEHWPFIGDDDLAAIAAGFRPRAKAKRAA